MDKFQKTKSDLEKAFSEVKAELADAQAKVTAVLEEMPKCINETELLDLCEKYDFDSYKHIEFSD